MARITLSLDRPTGNFWIDTGLVVLIQQFGEGEHEAGEVLRKLVDRLVQKTGKSGVYFDQDNGRFREYEKVNWVYPTNLFIKVPGVAPKIERQTNGKKEKFFTQPPVFDLSLKLSRSKNPCEICGDVVPLTDAKMWMYPFVVEPGKFGTFYPSTKRGLKLCARCALSGLAGYIGWLWKAQGRDALHCTFLSSTPSRERCSVSTKRFGPRCVLKRRKGNRAHSVCGFVCERDDAWAIAGALSACASVGSALTGCSLSSGIAPRSNGGGTTGTHYALRHHGHASDEGAPGVLQIPAILLALRRLGGASGPSRGRKSPSAVSAYLWTILEPAGKNRETIWRERIAWAVLEFERPVPGRRPHVLSGRAPWMCSVNT